MSLKERGKVRADALDNFNRALKHWYDAQRPRLSLKDYLEGKADMHVHYIFRVSNLEARKFCAVLKLLKVEMERTIEDNLSIFDSIGIDTGAVSNRDGWQQKLVLVKDVKVVKEHEGVSVPTTSIIERLQLLNHCCGATAHPILDVCFSSLERPGILQEREVHGGGASLDTVWVSPFNQSPKQVIESGSGIVKTVANNQGPPNNVGLRVGFEPKEEFAGLCIGVFDDGIRFSFSNKGGDSDLEGVKVFLCPSDLRDKPGWKISDPLGPSSSGAQSC